MKIFKKLFYVFICVALALTVIGVQPVRAASIVVNTNADNLTDDGLCTLREALATANSDTNINTSDCVTGAGADVITFAANYTITLTSALPNISTAIIIEGMGETNTVIQANVAPSVATYRIFTVNGGNLTLRQLAVRNGRCIGACPIFPVSGGGILVTNSAALTLENVTISANTTPLGGSGGGIYTEGTTTITNSTINGNTANSYGGGIANNGTITIADSAISGNIANSYGGGVYNGGTTIINNTTISGNGVNTSIGGGIFNEGTMTISASAVSNNTANSGGGIFNNLNTTTIINSTISGNTASSGAGIYNRYETTVITNSAISGNIALGPGGGIYNQWTTNITASTISSNTASAGGGISNVGTINVANTTLTGNSTSTGGGAIRNGDSSMSLIGTTTLTNVTISGNTSSSQAATWNEYGTLNLTNTIIANSTGADCLNSSTFGANMNNLVEDNTCSPSLSGDPNLGPLASNGGPTQTLALLAGSLAIDAGTNAGCPATDQRGTTRPQGTQCDIGAYEGDSAPPTVITTSLLASYTVPGPNNFTVTFSENVADYAGNTSPNDATNPLNYMVVEDGADSVFNTVSCAGGLAGDDTQAAITSVTYNAALYTSTVTLSAALPVGVYRLFVCGTTSIEDPAFNELNGGLSDYTFNFVVVSASVTNASSLPKTGFAPNKITTLPAQPAELAYSALGDLWLEIPALKVKSTIVGVPQADNKTWNVDWLGNNAGWLNGSAFPTWNGNSVLTAHVTNANGLAGPFANLKELKYGDRIIVHLFGQQYIYEVRETRVARPYATSYAFQSLQDHAYLTLITCQGYNASDDSYTYRRIVRAVLVDVK